MAVILPSVYKDGTATVNNGGTTVTGQNTLFVNSVLPGDFFGVHKGFAIRIASVDSNTSLTLANPWPGVTQTASAYEIMLQSDNARMQETSRQLLTTLSSGNAYSLSQLNGTPGDVPIFQTAGVFSKINLSAQAQAFIAGGVLPNGQLPERIRSFASQVSGANALDSIQESGWVNIASGNVGTVNAPPGAAAGYCLTIRSTTAAAVQIYMNAGGNDRFWFRRQFGPSFLPWQLVGQPTIGTVSQASGVPTGAIIERGSNANGEYVRFADGTQECWLTAVIDQSIPAGGVVSGTWALPAPFVNAAWTPSVNVRGLSAASAALAAQNIRGVLGSINASSGSWAIFNGHSGSNTLRGDLMAIGRWF